MARTRRPLKAKLLFLAALAVVLFVGGLIASSGEKEDVAAAVPQVSAAAGEARTSHAEISRLILDNREIELSPVQEAVQRTAA